MDLPLSESCSQWCHRMQEARLDKGDVDSAMAYFEMANLWKSRVCNETLRRELGSLNECS